jgi:uncharacterized membrane protein
VRAGYSPRLVAGRHASGMYVSIVAMVFLVPLILFIGYAVGEYINEKRHQQAANERMLQKHQQQR